MWKFLKSVFGVAPAPVPVAEPVEDKTEIFSERMSIFAEEAPDTEATAYKVMDYVNAYAAMQPVNHLKNGDGTPYAFDSNEGQGGPLELKQRMRVNQPNLSDMLTMWYASQSFIGHQLAAIIAQHWMVQKVCAMPGDDAIRKGFTVVTEDGDALSQNTMRLYARADKRFHLKKNLREYITMGRIFGVRIVIFKIKGFGPKDYEKPFNPATVTEGSYQGMVQVDPYWTAPELDQKASAQSDTMHFYEPTWWNINGTRYHRTHLQIYRHGHLADILKPAYLYGGMPVPQQIMERVYAAERVANEAPMLALTKRTTTYKTDLAKAAANWGKLTATVQKWTKFWTNFGVRVIDTEEEVAQTDTSLSDLDTVIMTSYQIVCAAGCVPSTKLMGTAPKGFNATGEFDESSYHESLESMQENDLTPLIERHHLMVRLSEIKFKDSQQGNIVTSVQWEPLDIPTALEHAQTNLAKAQTGQALIAGGAIDQVDERNRLINEKDGDYVGLKPTRREDLDTTPPPNQAGEVVHPAGNTVGQTDPAQFIGT